MSSSVMCDDALNAQVGLLATDKDFRGRNILLLGYTVLQCQLESRIFALKEPGATWSKYRWDFVIHNSSWY